jgi:hypothetical protein
MKQNFQPCVDCRVNPAVHAYFSLDGAMFLLCGSCNDSRMHADSRKEGENLIEILKLKTVRTQSVLP